MNRLSTEPWEIPRLERKTRTLELSRTGHSLRSRLSRRPLELRPACQRILAGRVLNGNGVPIAGLYACGNDMTSPMRGIYPGAGITIGPAIVFAYRAVNSIVQSTHQGQTAAASGA
ncbi:FAD-binding protein [Bradyrhizobium ottawaense]|uniref:FAD-binding protein n=1 Tax=Bradyrhizobium ottawaense TaxID=931866 RepID=UPI0038507C44